jgi:hypothetical protein
MAKIPKIVETLTSATEDDLAAIQSAIAELETELNATISEKRKTIDALSAIAKVIDLRLHGKPARKKMQRRSKSAPPVPGESQAVDELDEAPRKLRDDIYDLIFKEGPMPLPAIAASLNVAPQAVSMSIRKTPEWFATRNGEVAIAKVKG